MTDPRKEEMTDPRKEELLAEDLQVHLTVDDARTAQAAGARFARTLTGAYSQDFALALDEQAELIARAITDAGHSAAQAQLAADHFEEAAWDEWQRIADAGGGFLGHA